MSPEKMTQAYEENGRLVSSKQFDGLNNEDAKKKIAEWRNQCHGHLKIHWRLRDWFDFSSALLGYAYSHDLLCYLRHCAGSHNQLPVDCLPMFRLPEKAGHLG